MSHFVFRIGPLPNLQDPTFAYFVEPGRPAAQVFFSASDEGAIQQIAHAYPDESVALEPGLAEAARRFSYPVEDYTPARRHALGMVAYDLALPGAHKRISTEGLVYQFGIASAKYFGAQPWTYRTATLPVQLALSGHLRGRRTAWITGATGGDPGLATYVSAPDLLSVGGRSTPEVAKTVEKIDTIGVVFDRSMPFANDAMERAYGLAAVPVSINVVHGRSADIVDADLLLLAAALQAVSELDDVQDESHGYVKVGEMEQSVFAWRK